MKRLIRWSKWFENLRPIYHKLTLIGSILLWIRLGYFVGKTQFIEDMSQHGTIEPDMGAEIFLFGLIGTIMITLCALIIWGLYEAWKWLFDDNRTF